jgi:D-alanyl-D-alanine dipeptidase
MVCPLILGMVCFGFSGRTATGQAIDSPPPLPPSHFVGLIGEYVHENRVLIILEDAGRLHLAVEKSNEPLEEISADSYAFPGTVGKKLDFKRDAAGKATEANLSGVVYKRRAIDGEDGQTFRITPTRPVEQIRREIDGLKPPVEPEKKPADLVDLVDFVPGLKLDIRYASTNNFLSTPLYTSARALMQRPAAEALAKVQADLKPRGLGLLIHDAYRPWRVTKLFWEATPEANHLFVADPSKGSRHNRGCAVDLTLLDLQNGRPIAMVGGYDEFSDRSYPNYPGGTSRQRYYRNLLRTAMEKEGFTVFETEWWHFDFNGWRDYPIIDIPFESMTKK